MTGTTAHVESPRWWSKDTIAVVTGGNKGIGFEIVRQLASQGITTILTARDESRGLQALSALKEDGLDVLFHQLDVTNSKSIGKLATWIKAEFGGLDILVNNAGVAWSSLPDKVLAAKEVLDTNYYGVKNLTHALLPLFRPSAAGSRVINVSSMAGQLAAVGNDKWKQQLNDEENLNEAVIESFIKVYLKDRAEGTDTVLLMPSQELLETYGNYIASKAACNAHTRVMARDLANRKEGEKIFVNCMCPGVTNTGMSHNRGHSVEEGADTAVWLVLLPASECVTGKFFLKRTDRGFLYIEEAHAPIAQPKIPQK
ncbi:hypothetical protein O6H91_03G033200 [Diphasiastrum complanatum]|uniref:Uncharacterized protein n=1 Tax=Diphasiastrum complanatum TaxID=34168 RepID=A0ACC2E573_DIPCM|nr:hypothetical protein O6H91_03G033200 [Diphasiastrum complanatum]